MRRDNAKARKNLKNNTEKGKNKSKVEKNKNRGKVK